MVKAKSVNQVESLPVLMTGIIVAGVLLIGGIPQKVNACPSPSRLTKSEPIATVDDPSNPIWTPQRVEIVRKSNIPLSCASVQLTLVSVMDTVFNLPEVKQRAYALAPLSGGIEVSAMLLKPEPGEQTRYYTIQVFEQHPDRKVNLWLLRVNRWMGAIEVQDNRTGSYIPLEQWRQQR